MVYHKHKHKKDDASGEKDKAAVAPKVEKEDKTLKAEETKK